MKIKEFEKKLQHTANNLKVHVEKEEKDGFRMHKQNPEGVALASSYYAGTVRIYIDMICYFHLFRLERTVLAAGM